MADSDDDYNDVYVNYMFDGERGQGNGRGENVNEGGGGQDNERGGE